MATAKEIQTEVLTAQQELLQEAERIVRGKSTNEGHVNTLKELGFTGSANVLGEKMEKANELAELADMYSFEYPGLKFIPDQVMSEVCRKYGLGIGHVSRYMGEVPAWALAQIKANKHHLDTIEIFDERKYDQELERFKQERFKEAESQGLKEVSVAYGRLVQLWSQKDGHHEGPAGHSTYRFENGQWHFYSAGTGGYLKDYLPRTAGNVRVPDITIAAPRNEMRLDRNEQFDEDGNIFAVSEDPIVCKKVKGGYIVLAAWGEEGSDPRVFNAGSN
jgi:hypothetical protein